MYFVFVFQLLDLDQTYNVHFVFLVFVFVFVSFYLCLCLSLFVYLSLLHLSRHSTLTHTLSLSLNSFPNKATLNPSTEPAEVRLGPEPELLNKAEIRRITQEQTRQAPRLSDFSVTRRQSSLQGDDLERHRKAQYFGIAISFIFFTLAVIAVSFF